LKRGFYTKRGLVLLVPKSISQWVIRLNNDFWALVVVQDALKQAFIQNEPKIPPLNRNLERGFVMTPWDGNLFRTFNIEKEGRGGIFFSAVFSSKLSSLPS